MNVTTTTRQDPATGALAASYCLTSPAEFEARNPGCRAPAGKRYFAATALPDIVAAYPFKQVGGGVGREGLGRVVDTSQN